MENIGAIAVSYTFKNTSTLNLDLFTTLYLATENNSVLGSALIEKWKSYDGKGATYQTKMGHHTRLVYTATKYLTFDIH